MSHRSEWQPAISKQHTAKAYAHIQSILFTFVVFAPYLLFHLLFRIVCVRVYVCNCLPFLTLHQTEALKVECDVLCKYYFQSSFFLLNSYRMTLFVLSAHQHIFFRFDFLLVHLSIFHYFALSFHVFFRHYEQWMRVYRLHWDVFDFVIKVPFLRAQCTHTNASVYARCHIEWVRALEFCFCFFLPPFSCINGYFHPIAHWVQWQIHLNLMAGPHSSYYILFTCSIHS